MNINSKSRPEEFDPEIVIGLVSPVGTDLQPVIRALKHSFEDVRYDFHHIKISQSFKEIANATGDTSIDDVNERNRIEKYIDFGNGLRSRYGNDFLAGVAFAQIILKRNTFPEIDRSKPSRKVYVVDQLKTQGEIDRLRVVYGEAFFQVSVFSARDIRVDHIARKIAKSENKRDVNPYRGEAEALVNRDDNEKEEHGQKVGKIFQLADVVINVDKDVEISVSDQVNRFVQILFGSNSISPNRFEYGMYLAHSAALRSLDLSRQVGAAIFRKTGEIATLGANEVPKAGGGTYWVDEVFDAREFTKGVDSNEERKQELLNEVMRILAVDLGSLTKEQLAELKDSQFMDALEYGRIVHAEMSALTDAARLGISVEGGTLFCTTFPCHMCSKHIVASGIESVVFLEPYPKSLTSDLHSDSVKIEGASRGRFSSFPSVRFNPFYGITPKRYRDLFYRTKRKGSAGFLEYKGGRPSPIFGPIEPNYGELENWYAVEALNRYSPAAIPNLTPEAELVGPHSEV